MFVITKKFPNFLALLFLTCSLSFSICNVYSQQPTQEWAVRFSGPYNDLYGPFLQVDRMGNSYVAGTHVINDSINILCVKYNTAGIQQWVALYKYPGYGYFSPSGLALDSFGNAYVIADFGPGFTSPLNGLIVKFNNLTGSTVWVRSYIGQYGQSSFDDIEIDRLNNIYLVGGSDSSHLTIHYDNNGDSIWVRKYHPLSCSEGFGACTLDDSLNIISTGIRRHFFFSGYYDSLLVTKYSSNGVLRWQSTFSGGLTNSNWSEYITADQSGNVYVGGGTTPSGYAVFLTLKYDRNGIRQWVTIFDPPGSGSNYLNGIVLDRINNALLVTGSAISNGVQVASTIKYDLITGDSIWAKRDTGTNRNGDSRSIKMDTLGNSYITGVSSSTGSGAPVDIMTLKYLNNGNRAWITSYNGPYSGLDIGRDLALDASNNVYVLGTSQSAFQLTDYVLMKYNQISGIRIVGSDVPITFILKQNYPNPFNPITKIRFSLATPFKGGAMQTRLTIYDVLGREVAALVNEQLKPGSYEVDLDASKYTSGVYFYQLTADGNIIDTKKMIVLK